MKVWTLLKTSILLEKMGNFMFSCNDFPKFWLTFLWHFVGIHLLSNEPNPYNPHDITHLSPYHNSHDINSIIPWEQKLISSVLLANLTAHVWCINVIMLINILVYTVSYLTWYDVSRELHTSPYQHSEHNKRVIEWNMGLELYSWT